MMDTMILVLPNVNHVPHNVLPVLKELITVSLVPKTDLVQTNVVAHQII
jgi:hypothetical protein